MKRIGKYLLAIGLAMLLMPSMACAGGEKVVDKSGKEPKWLNGMQEDYLIYSGEAQTIEDARDKAMMAIKAEIASSVATNVKSSASHYVNESEDNGKFDLKAVFMKQIETKTANIPYLNEISANKAEDYYWEKIKVNKNEFKYRYHIKYRFTKLDLMRMVDEFKSNEAKINKKLQEFADDDFKSYKSVEDMEKRVTALKTFQESLMQEDDRRKTCATVLDAYRKYFTQISIRPIEISKEEAVFAPYYGENQLTTQKKPQMKTNCLTELQYFSDGDKCKVTYDYNTACYPDEQNWLEVIYTFSGKKVSNKFFIK
ncbi:MAG: hypothetical protein IJ834_05650 [Paludibacteraceae bacterium]|nr:hypothetical protein [Paludibacteraceae bacterium]